MRLEVSLVHFHLEAIAATLLAIYLPEGEASPVITVSKVGDANEKPNKSPGV